MEEKLNRIILQLSALTTKVDKLNNSFEEYKATDKKKITDISTEIRQMSSKVNGVERYIKSLSDKLSRIINYRN